MKKLLLTGCFPFTQNQIDEICALGYEVTFHKDEREIVVNPELYDVVVCNGLFLYNDIAKFSNLKAIQVTSAGLDRLPLSYIDDHKIELNNARGVYSIPIAEFVIMNILNVLHENQAIIKNMKDRKWEKVRTCRELFNQNILIVGCGSIGQEIAKRLKAFSCNVIGINPQEVDNSYFDEIKSLDELENLLPWASIVILSCPLNETSKQMMNYRRILLMKDDAILVNIARGELIVEKDLINILKERPQFNAILDVFEEEPLPAESLLWDLPNAIISPHNSFVSIMNNGRMYERIVEFLKKMN